MGKREEKEVQLPRVRREVANIFIRPVHHHQMSWRSGRFLVTGKRQVSHSSSRRAGRTIQGQTDQSANLRPWESCEANPST